MRRPIALLILCVTIVAGAAATDALLAEGTVTTPIHTFDVGPDGYLDLDVERVALAPWITVTVEADGHGTASAKLVEGQRFVVAVPSAAQATVTVACPPDVSQCRYTLRDESTNSAADFDPDRRTEVRWTPLAPSTPTTTTTVAGTSTTQAPAPSPSVPVEDAVLLASYSPDRSNPFALDGATLGGTVYVFADLSANEGPVYFDLDGTRIQRERFVPFDARGGSVSKANPWDTTGLADGVHVLKVQYASGSHEVQFTVANDGPVTAAPSKPTEVAPAPTTTTTTAPKPTTTTTTAPKPTTTTEAPAPSASGGSTHLVIDRDRVVMNALVLRPGDTIEFRNGARLIFENGGYADWQGTPTSTWSNDGKTMNLERDIEVFGEGHVMFHATSKPSTIRFVEFDLQPKQELGHYPLHWHLVGDDSRGTLVEGTVIKNSTNRAYVPHGSHGITFRDTIAHNIQGSAYWWDPPVFQGGPDENNSDDIVLDRALAHTVTNHFEDSRGFRLAAFTMSAGRGNVVKDSVARNIEPSHRKDCAGFGWPELSHLQERVWTFENNATFESDCHGTFVWQNGREVTHVIDGFRGDAISHGAYSNDYVYRNVDVEGVIAHAVGWSVSGGNVGDVWGDRSQFDGSVRFSNVTVDSITIDNASNGGVQPVDYVFENVKGVSCGDVVWKNVTSGTTVTINGTSCRR